MKIEIEVSADQLSNDIREVLENLTLKQKSQMAERILTQTMKDVECKFSRRLGINEALKEMNEKRKDRSGKFVWDEESGLKIVGGSSWEHVDSGDRRMFDDLTGKYADVHHYFKNEILKRMMDVALKKVEEEVTQSDKISTAIEAAAEQIESMFPEMVRRSMERIFVKNVLAQLNLAPQALSQMEDQKKLMESLEDRLNRANIPY